MKMRFVPIALGLLTLTASADPFHVGDLVKVSSQNPLVVLGKARITAVTSNTVTVTTDFDTYTFRPADTVIVPLVPRSVLPAATPGGSASTEPQAQAAAPAYADPQAGQPGSNTANSGGPDPGLALLGKFSGEPGYDNAVKLYQDDDRIKYGFNAVMPKPYSFDELQQIVLGLLM